MKGSLELIDCELKIVEENSKQQGNFLLNYFFSL